MPRNGSGTYSLPEPPFVAGTVISSAAVNDDLSDIASALTQSLPRDGQAGMTGQFKATDGSIIAPSMSFTNDLNTGFFRPGDDTIGVVIGGVQVGTFDSGGFQGQTPIGSVIDYAGSTVPTLWVLCYGQAINRITYALLFAIIGTTYGSGDGATTFNLPDLRGRTTYGRDDMGTVAASRLTTAFFGSSPIVLGNGGGTQSKSLITANVPAYTPTGIVGINDPGHVHSTNAVINGSTQSDLTPGSVIGCGGGASVFSASTGVTAGFNGNAQGGSSTAFAIVSPGIIFNKIIFAGA